MQGFTFTSCLLRHLELLSMGSSHVSLLGSDALWKDRNRLLHGLSWPLLSSHCRCCSPWKSWRDTKSNSLSGPICSPHLVLCVLSKVKEIWAVFGVQGERNTEKGEEQRRCKEDCPETPGRTYIFRSSRSVMFMMLYCGVISWLSNTLCKLNLCWCELYESSQENKQVGFSVFCSVKTVILHFPSESDTEFNSSNESLWHSQIISFSNVRWSWHKLLIIKIYLCVKHIINKEIWQAKRETTTSELLLLIAISFQGVLGVTSSPCFSTQSAEVSGPKWLIIRRV